MTIDEELSQKVAQMRANGEHYEEYLQGAEWAMERQKKELIEKAREWLFQEFGDSKIAYPSPCDDDENRWASRFTEDVIDSFVKAMEE